MGTFEILVIGVGLSMDAVAVSISNGIVYKKLKLKDYAMMPLFFGTFQALMPLLGFYAGSVFAHIITKYSGTVIFLIMVIIGGNMIRESFSDKGERETDRKLGPKILFFQAVATSIDAFAVGVGLAALRVDIIPSVAVIGVTTAIMSTVAILIGKKCGDIFKSKSELLGGVILIIIGIKALF